MFSQISIDLTVCVYHILLHCMLDDIGSNDVEKKLYVCSMDSLALYRKESESYMKSNYLKNVC